MDLEFSKLTDLVISPIIDSADDYFCWVTEWYDGGSVDLAIAFSKGGRTNLLCKVMGRRIHQCTLDDAKDIVNLSVPRARFSEIMQHVIDLGVFNLVSEHVMTRTVDCDALIGVKWQGMCHWVKITSAQHRNPDIDLVVQRLDDYVFEIFPELGNFYEKHNQGGSFSDVFDVKDESH